MLTNSHPAACCVLASLQPHQPDHGPQPVWSCLALSPVAYNKALSLSYAQVVQVEPLRRSCARDCMMPAAHTAVPTGIRTVSEASEQYYYPDSHMEVYVLQAFERFAQQGKALPGKCQSQCLAAGNNHMHARKAMAIGGFANRSNWTTAVTTEFRRSVRATQRRQRGEVDNSVCRCAHPSSDATSALVSREGEGCCVCLRV